MLRSGTLPRNISENTKDKLMAKIRHGGKSIEELTNYCKKLSTAEDLGELSELSDSDNDGDGKPRAFHHPFEVKDRGPIVMNIRVKISNFMFNDISLIQLFLEFGADCAKTGERTEGNHVAIPRVVWETAPEGREHLGPRHNSANPNCNNPNRVEASDDARKADPRTAAGTGQTQADPSC